MSIKLENITVLCLDDEAGLRDMYRRSLGKEVSSSESAADLLAGLEISSADSVPRAVEDNFDFAYDVITAASGEEALEIIESRQKAGLPPITVGFFDMKLYCDGETPPKTDGLMTIKKARLLDPAMLCVIVTAMDNYAEKLTHLNDTFRDAEDELLFLRKPVSRAVLQQTARNLVSSWNRKRQLERYDNGIQRILQSTAELMLVLSAPEDLASCTHRILRDVSGRDDFKIELSTAEKTAILCTGLFKQEAPVAIQTFEVGCDENLFGRISIPAAYVGTTKRLIELFSTHLCHLLLTSSYRTVLTAKEEEVVTDQLTGLYNRKFIKQQLLQQLESLDQPTLDVAVVMVDLDHFKSVNDTYGHSVGDAVLQQIGTLIRGQVRSSDIIQRVDADGAMFAVRYGGEEFLLIICGVSAVTAKRIADRLRIAVEEHTFSCGDVRLFRTASLGVAAGVFNASGHEDADAFLNSLVKKADSALYRAKASGRNKVEMEL